VMPDYLVGNIYEKSAPPAFFKDWLVGPLADWAAKDQGNNAVEKRAKAEEFAILSTDGARRNVEVKIIRLAAGRTSPAGRDDETGITTLVVLMKGKLNTELVSRADRKNKVVELKRDGDFLAWRSSVFNHKWKSVAESVSVTVRWSEKYAS